MFMHRPPKGEIKTLTIKRDRVGDWYVILAAELPDPEPKKELAGVVGVDLGLTHLVTLSSGDR